MDVNNYKCRDCVYFPNQCKRIDHNTIKFAKPYFIGYDGNHIPCCDFKPKNLTGWTGFNDWWPYYVEQWIPYQNTDINTYFTLHSDPSIRYGVPLMDFVNGTMIENGVLKAVEKMYYKQTRKGCGYKLVYEEIKGVVIDAS